MATWKKVLTATPSPTDLVGSDGDAGQVLKTNGSGTLAWVDQSEGTTNLSVTQNGTQFLINSSSGTNVSVGAASSSQWGVLSDDDWTTFNGKQDAITAGIADGNYLTANANVADNDFLRIDGTEVEGRTATQVKSDLGLIIGTDVQAYDAQLATLAAMSTAEIDAFAALTDAEIGILDGAAVSNATTNKAVKTDATTAGKVTIPTLVVGSGGAEVGGTLTMGTNLLSMGTGGAQVVAGTLTFKDSTNSTTGSFNAQTGALICENLTVNGTTTTINSTNLTVDDKLIRIADVADGSVSTTTGSHSGIQVKTATDANSAHWPDIKWTKDQGAHTATSGTADGLTGWIVSNHRTSGQTDHPIAIMDFDSAAPTSNDNSAGIGSFWFDDGELYLRTA